MQVLTRDQFAEFQANPTPRRGVTRPTTSAVRASARSSSFAAFRGGATFTFRGIDEDVCSSWTPRRCSGRSRSPHQTPRRTTSSPTSSWTTACGSSRACRATTPAPRHRDRRLPLLHRQPRSRGHHRLRRLHPGRLADGQHRPRRADHGRLHHRHPRARWRRVHRGAETFNVPVDDGALSFPPWWSRPLAPTASASSTRSASTVHPSVVADLAEGPPRQDNPQRHPAARAGLLRRGAPALLLRQPRDVRRDRGPPQHLCGCLRRGHHPRRVVCHQRPVLRLRVERGVEPSLRLQSASRTHRTAPPSGAVFRWGTSRMTVRAAAMGRGTLERSTSPATPPWPMTRAGLGRLRPRGLRGPPAEGHGVCARAGSEPPRRPDPPPGAGPAHGVWRGHSPGAVSRLAQWITRATQTAPRSSPTPWMSCSNESPTPSPRPDGAPSAARAAAYTSRPGLPQDRTAPPRARKRRA